MCLIHASMCICCMPLSNTLRFLCMHCIPLHCIAYLYTQWCRTVLIHIKEKLHVVAPSEPNLCHNETLSSISLFQTLYHMYNICIKCSSDGSSDKTCLLVFIGTVLNATTPTNESTLTQFNCFTFAQQNCRTGSLLYVQMYVVY